MMSDGSWASRFDDARWLHIIELAKKSASERMRLLDEAIRFAVRAGARTREDILTPVQRKDRRGPRDT